MSLIQMTHPNIAGTASVPSTSQTLWESLGWVAITDSTDPGVFGTLANRPAASIYGSGFYFATDVNGGTLYYSNGTAWAQRAPGLSELADGAVSSVNGHSGVVTLVSDDLADFDANVRTNRLDQMAVPTADVAFNGHKATGVADPVNPQDAATRAWVESLGAGAADASALGYIDGTNASYGMVADAVLVEDGVVASGALSTLTSATARFTSDAVGKSVTLYQTVVISDAAMTTGSAVLTSASNAVPTWVKPGMKIIINNASSSSLALVALVVSNDGIGQLTLDTTAARTATGAAQVFAMHQTTISARTNSTTVSLTAAAPYAFSAASTVYGTDNRAAIATAAAAAKTANKTLWVPSGNYLVLPTSGNPYATGVLTNGTFTFRGAGRAATKFILAYGAVPTFDNGLIGGGTGITIDAADFTWAYVGPPPTAASSGGLAINLARAGTAKLTLRAKRVDADTTHLPWMGMRIQGGTGTVDTVADLDDCQLAVTAHAFQYFVNTGTVAKFYAKYCRFESNYSTQNVTDQSGNWHPTYIHPSVGIDWVGCTTKATGPGGTSLYHLHLNGSPSDVPPFWRLTEHTSEGVGKFNLSANNIRKMVFERCKIRHDGPGITTSGPADVVDCEFYNDGQTGIVIETATASFVTRVQGCHFGGTGASTTAVSMSGATAGILIVKDVSWVAPTAGLDFMTLASQPLTAIIEDCVFDGSTVGQDIVRVTTQAKLFVRRTTVLGSWVNAPFYTDVGAGALVGYAEFDNCDFSQMTTSGAAAIKDFTATGTDGNFTVLPTNKFGDKVCETSGRTGHRAMARPMLATATVAAASATSITWDANRFHLTSSGATDIKNVYRGGSAAKNKMSGDLVTIRNVSANVETLKHGTGNLTCATGADIALATNEAAECFADGLGGWYVHKLAA